MILLNFFVEIVKFIIYSFSIVVISKYILVGAIRKLAGYLKLNSKTVGNIAGYATSVPELLTVTASSANGLIGASMYNILSSNIINFIQYMASILINKNQKFLKNKLIKIDIILIALTILIPIVFIIFNIETKVITAIIFVGIYLFFRYIDKNAHKLYSKEKNKKEQKISEIREWKKSIIYIILLIISSMLLFVIGNLLGDTLENLCNSFNIPQIIIGIFLGVITSIPELITFFEAQKHHKQENNENGVIEATNNLFTSNTLNLFIIQSIGVLIYTLLA